MVGFCDLVGTGIAPVSTKTAVKRFGNRYPEALGDKILGWQHLDLLNWVRTLFLINAVCEALLIRIHRYTTYKKYK